MFKEEFGNLVDQSDEFDAIVHGCNCFNTMGAGIAASIKAKFPEAYEVDCETKKGDPKKLGTITYTKNTVPTIINAYTQYAYWGKVVLCDYSAIRSCMKKIKEQFSGKKIGIPMIGAGLAGGDWNVIKPIIQEELDGEDVRIIYLKQ